MRFAGQVFNKFSEQNDFSEADDYMKRIQGVERTRPEIQNPVVPGFNTEDLIPTPELPAGTPFNQNDKGRYIQQVPGSGISMLPNGEQGPSQGPNTPIKNYGGQYMPDATQPTGYKHGPMAMSPGCCLLYVIRGAVQGQPTADGTLYKGQPDPFQENNKIRPSDSDDQFMDVMRSGFV